MQRRRVEKHNRVLKFEGMSKGMSTIAIFSPYSAIFCLLCAPGELALDCVDVRPCTQAAQLQFIAVAFGNFAVLDWIWIIVARSRMLSQRRDMTAAEGQLLLKLPNLTEVIKKRRVGFCFKLHQTC